MTYAQAFQIALLGIFAGLYLAVILGSRR